MIRITKIADYGILLMAEMAAEGVGAVHNARCLSDSTRIPQPMVSKILKTLAREGLLISHRGQKGGYSLSRTPGRITVAEIITALEGPIAIIECADHEKDHICDLQEVCAVSSPWKRINDAVCDALSAITLEEMVQPCCGSSQGLAEEGVFLTPKILN
ncbi:MAG: SUF system Fe-S cluster assembly regulator [Candidatus Omnitrophica bacterium]|nr:SUF system Fe-S cluster assembly regulator [Candidatus Omnitrophota bacterium]MCA9415548.1 SUF system Fe-S cluster assembly regulator [Candidatus Omnitrophota bacterium]MCA9425667.1 SUF system Fe-S cluster assembly regulator [Candidatus Omnitrophota bacterium]MCA9444664.1 SUF system Fe-S cluster assembly regulator [Candidatus Omnitrophota bacterium]MCB9768753.1 SUF system Fe-S cluster assembly regulator [Candidatus Omnitrophota bacterium]